MEKKKEGNRGGRVESTIGIEEGTEKRGGKVGEKERRGKWQGEREMTIKYTDVS